MPRVIPLIPSPVRRLYRRVFPHRPPDYASMWRNACQKWIVGGIDVSGGKLAVNGWLIAPSELRFDIGFRVNGVAPEHTQYPLARPDVEAEKGRFVADAGKSGFILWLEGTESYDFEIMAVHQQTGQPLGGDYLPVHVPSREHLGPVPGTANVRRVIGEGSAFNFAMGGYTAFQRLVQAVREATGADLSAYPRVLDWGCGCARVSRYFFPLPGMRVTGVDVDVENIGWCRANLPIGEWDVVPLRPPTPLPDAGFDLAIGVSVFTHLREPEQFAWLAELRRVLRPGGLALMTIHGDASVVWSGLSAERYALLIRDGICDQANPLYDAAIGETDYYRDTFHTANYVRREWGQSFEVLAIRPCFIAHQDLVVMRRR